MDGQEPTETNEPVAVQETSDTTPAEAQSAHADIAARLSKLEAENTKLRQESASRRVKAKEANEARQAALEENSQFKELSEHLKGSLTQAETEIARLKELEGPAQSWQQWQESESARIEQACADLPENQRAVVMSIPDVSARASALNAFTQTTGPNKPPPNASPAASKAVVDWSKIGEMSAGSFKELVEQNPESWREYTSAGNDASKSTFASRLRNKKR